MKNYERPFDRSAEEVINFLTLCQPPEKFEYAGGLVFTYSLDPGVALCMLFSAHGVQASIAEGEAEARDFSNLETHKFLNDVVKKTSFFVNGHCELESLRKFREQVSESFKHCLSKVAVHRTKNQNGPAYANFHPKLAILNFRNGEKELVRIYLGSKNLTAHPAMESGLLLEFSSDRHGRGKPHDIFKGLSRFLGQLKNEAKFEDRFKSSLKEWSGRLLRWQRVFPTVELPESFSEVSFHWQTPNSKTRLWKYVNRDLKKASAVTVVSPWLSDGTVSSLAVWAKNRGPEHLTIWCLNSEFHRLRPLVGLGRLLTGVSEDIYDVAGDGLQIDRELALAERSQVHHSKLFGFDFASNEGSLWIGSANWTEPGLGHSNCEEPNFELLLRLSVRGKATELLPSGEEGQIITELMASPRAGDGKIKSNPERVLLDWFDLNWASYPVQLGIECGLPAQGQGKWRKNLKVECVGWVNDDEISLGSFKLGEIFRKGSLVLKTNFSKSTQLDAVLQLRFLRESRFYLVPLPEWAVNERFEKILEARKITSEDYLRRLIELQSGIKRKKRNRGRQEGSPANSYELLTEDLEIERIFNSLIDNPDGAGKLLTEIKKIRDSLASLRRKLPSNHEKYRIDQLEISLSVLLKESKGVA